MVRAENKRHRPDLSEYQHGVLGSMVQCISLTVTERIQLLDLSGLDLNSASVAFSFTWGLDGSGDHSDYHQLSKCDYTTKQVMSICFSVRGITVKDAGKQVDWSSSETGANRPQNTRPLGLFPAKESSTLLQDLIPRIEREVNEIKEEGVKVDLGGSTVQAICKKSKLSMADGKMVNTLLHLEGAYCTMCTKDQDECQKEAVIENGFLIDRSVEMINDVALALANPDNGEIVKKKGDYKKRAGVCGQTITGEDLTKNIPVCHSKIRVFEFIMELLIRYLSHQKWYSKTNRVTYTPEEGKLYTAARENVKEVMKSNLAVNIGNPGNRVGKSCGLCNLKAIASAKKFSLKVKTSSS